MKRSDGQNLLAGAVAAASLMFQAAGAAGLPPELSAVPGKPNLPLGNYEVGSLGYDVSEFFLSGTAQSYVEAGPVHEDGRWNVRPASVAPYKTRLVAVIPHDRAKFNGTVIVEWLNVSGGLDVPVEWSVAHRELVRKGYAYVAVSAQKVGVEGGPNFSGGPNRALKVLDPRRYGVLSHPGDAYAYDIFSQAGRVVRAGAVNGLLSGLAPKRVIAMGESQSAIFLTTYVPAVDPLATVYDGFLIHSRFGAGARLDGVTIVDAPPGVLPESVKMPLKPRVPVLTVVTETDVTGGPIQGYYSARQPDGPNLRVWEIAGASHADNYTYLVGSIDTGSATIDTLARAYAPTSKLFGQTFEKPINFGPQQHYVVEAAVASLDAWLRSGKAPPVAVPLSVAEPPEGGKPLKFALDDLGNAKGGVRTPWVDAPTAILAGNGSSGPGAWINGVGVPFAEGTLQRLYPGGKADYMRKFEHALNSSIRAGFILPEDRQEILDLASASYMKAP